MFVNPEHPDVKSGEFKLAVSLGLVPGWQIYRKFGLNDQVGSGTQEIWPPGTARVLPTAAALAIATSDDAQDDIVAITGTGSWTIGVNGLDANGDEITDYITMRGAVPAFTTKAFLRINRAWVETAGTSEVNTGNISVTIGGDLQAYIQAGTGQTLQTQFSVPRGRTFIVTSFQMGVGRMGGTSDLVVYSQIKGDYPDSTWRTASAIYLWNGQIVINNTSVHLLRERSEIRQVVSSTSATQTYGEWEGYLVDNSYLPEGWLLDA